MLASYRNRSPVDRIAVAAMVLRLLCFLVGLGLRLFLGIAVPDLVVTWPTYLFFGGLGVFVVGCAVVGAIAWLRAERERWVRVWRFDLRAPPTERPRYAGPDDAQTPPSRSAR